jgi:DNA-binding MarR family transcriptional regulator
VGTRGEPLSDAVHGLGLALGVYSDAGAAMVGLHSTDWRILDVLCHVGELSAGEVATYLGVSNGAITGAVDRLERAGAVRRVRGQDRRKVMLQVVKDGDERVEAAYDRLYAEFAQLHEELTDEQLELVLGYLRKATEAVQRTTSAIRG